MLRAAGPKWPCGARLLPGVLRIAPHLQLPDDDLGVVQLPRAVYHCARAGIAVSPEKSPFSSSRLFPFKVQSPPAAEQQQVRSITSARTFDSDALPCVQVHRLLHQPRLSPALTEHGAQPVGGMAAHAPAPVVGYMPRFLTSGQASSSPHVWAGTA
jgi:hypothetical protein